MHCTISTLKCLLLAYILFPPGIDVMDRKKRSFESRTSVTNHPLARKLFEIMSSKKTNLCVAADVTTSAELISLAEKVSSEFSKMIDFECVRAR